MNWPTVRLGEIATLTSGGTPSRKNESFYEGDIPWISSADIEDNGSLKYRRFITQEAIEKSATQLVKPGTILLVTRIGVGKVAIANSTLAFSQDITALSDLSSNVHPEYLASFLRHIGSKKLSKMARGATVQGVTRRDVLGMQIPLPPLEEQKRVAEIMERIGSGRNRVLSSITLIRQAERHVYLTMFANEVVRGRVEQIVSGERDIRTGPFGSDLKKAEFTESGVPVLGLDNIVSNQFVQTLQRYISDEKYKELSRYTVYSGDVLISIMGTNGRCVVVPPGLGTMINTKHICAITPDQSKVLPQFLRAAFLWSLSSRIHLFRNTKGAVMSGLNMGIIKRMPIPIPDLDRQKRFVTASTTIARIAERLDRKRALLDELEKSLSIRAFSGQL